MSPPIEHSQAAFDKREAVAPPSEGALGQGSQAGQGLNQSNLNSKQRCYDLHCWLKKKKKKNASCSDYKNNSC